MKAPEAKILLYDLETSHNLLASFTTFKPIIPHDCILKERSIICACYKWLGDKKVKSISILDNPKNFDNDVYDDSYVAKKFREVIDKADILVAHNGDKYDLKFLNTRLLINKLPSLPKKTSVDTLKSARKHFRFNSNKLDAIAKVLGGEGKMGMGVNDWLDIIKWQYGNGTKNAAVKATKKIVKYCKQDITELEQVYLELRPFMDNHPNANLMGANTIESCPTCGSMDLTKQGSRYTRAGKKQQYKCNNCGSWSSARSAIMTADLR